MGMDDIRQFFFPEGDGPDLLKKKLELLLAKLEKRKSDNNIRVFDILGRIQREDPVSEEETDLVLDYLLSSSNNYTEGKLQLLGLVSDAFKDPSPELMELFAQMITEAIKEDE